MSKTVALICLLFVVALTLASSGASPAAAIPGVEASGSDVRATTFEARTALDGDASLWMRLRWIFAGVSLASILLVGARQLRLLALRDAARRQDRPLEFDAYGSPGGD